MLKLIFIYFLKFHKDHKDKKKFSILKKCLCEKKETILRKFVFTMLSDKTLVLNSICI